MKHGNSLIPRELRRLHHTAEPDRGGRYVRLCVRWFQCHAQCCQPQAGDVITAVNGQRLGDLEQDMMLFENWRSEPQLEIEIERDGSILTVSYAIPEQWR